MARRDGAGLARQGFFAKTMTGTTGRDGGEVRRDVMSRERGTARHDGGME
ncbi:MAG: hypothetical protein LBB09_02350 [Rickettsiales bacterium]|nr:hypothetical protein [Rickettsiales bacterium]